tara:strand:- start:1211 stop:1789 length:579 start_codon:yes stop_codon:yes gene_type:complete
MMNKFKSFLLVFFVIPLFLVSCGGWDPASVKDRPVDVDERVRQNIEEGKGFKLGDKRDSGLGSFASSNPLWRATLDTLDFMVLNSVDYGGGIIITDWYSENKNDEAIKLTIRFLSPEIRADGLEISIHQKKCEINNLSNCTVQKLNTKLAEEIKLAILKRAVQIDKKITEKKRKEFKKKFPDFKTTGNQSAN